MVTSTNHVIAGPGLLCVDPWHFGDFRKGGKAPAAEGLGSGGRASSAQNFCIFFAK